VGGGSAVRRATTYQRHVLAAVGRPGRNNWGEHFLPARIRQEVLSASRIHRGVYPYIAQFYKGFQGIWSGAPSGIGLA
jgi:hypothetical protein